jgi:hypothetical protein
MKNHNKLSHQQKEQEELAAQQSQIPSGKEFSSPEELLRFDAAQTSVPPGIAERLQNSSATVPPPSSRPWWKRMFGG